MTDAAADPWERGCHAAALAGDPAGWRGLYDAAFAAVARYARWRGGSADLGDEIAQEAWLTAARRLAAFDPGRGRFADWVCGIAARAARNLVRKRLRYAARVRPLAAVPEPASAGELPTADPERVALALADLPDRYEAALRAKYLDGRGVADIAAATGQTAKAVESLLTRAREAFRAAYDRRGDGS